MQEKKKVKKGGTIFSEIKHDFRLNNVTLTCLCTFLITKQVKKCYNSRGL